MANTEKDKYHIKLAFTKDKEHHLTPGVWTGVVARRIIKNELGLDPSTDNADDDIRYDTDDAATFIELMVIAHRHSKGGWFCVYPMPEEDSVYHFNSFGPDIKEDDK